MNETSFYCRRKTEKNKQKKSKEINISSFVPSYDLKTLSASFSENGQILARCLFLLS